MEAHRGRGEAPPRPRQERRRGWEARQAALRGWWVLTSLLVLAALVAALLGSAHGLMSMETQRTKGAPAVLAVSGIVIRFPVSTAARRACCAPYRRQPSPAAPGDASSMIYNTIILSLPSSTLVPQNSTSAPLLRGRCPLPARCAHRIPVFTNCTPAEGGRNQPRGPVTVSICCFCCTRHCRGPTCRRLSTTRLLQQRQPHAPSTGLEGAH